MSREGIREQSTSMTGLSQIPWLPKSSAVAFQACRWDNTSRAGQFIVCGLAVCGLMGCVEQVLVPAGSRGCRWAAP